MAEHSWVFQAGVTVPIALGGEEEMSMNRYFCGLTTLVVVFTGLAFASLAQAQATRTWVSGVGDDVNPCSRTAPCKTFAGAISKTAAGGEINVIDAGGFGAVTITKSITIDGGGSFASILASFTNGIVVNAGANDVVTIRNLAINGAGTGVNGISFLAGANLYVENVVIFEFSGRGIDASHTSVGILSVINTTITNCDAGIHLSAAIVVAASIDRTRVHGCGTGVLADADARAMVRDSDLSSNGTGLQANTGAEADVDTSLLAFSNVGIQANGGIVRITNNTVTNNGTGLATLAGGQIISFGNNKVTGNFSDGVPSSTTVPR